MIVLAEEQAGCLLVIGPAHHYRLLKHHHAQLDAELVPAYLEATGPRNVKLYGQHGYSPPFAYDADGGPQLFPMWRDSQPHR